jgi:hypothetical protein
MGGERTIVRLDPDEVQIAGALTPSIQAEVSRRVWTAERQALWRLVRTRLRSGIRTASGADAASIVKAGALQLDQRLRTDAARYSALQWLWMLRRVPAHVFSGDLSTTPGYDTTLAETLTGESPTSPHAMRIDDHGVWSFDTSIRALSALAEFCERVRFLSDLHRAHRWVCKGAEVEFSPNHSPKEIADAALRESVRIYDDRVAVGENVAGRVGTQLLGTIHGTDFDHVIVHLRQIVQTVLPIPATLHGGRTMSLDHDVTMSVRFLPQFSALTDLNSLRLVAGRFNICLLFIMHAASLYVRYHQDKFVGMLTRGYVMFDGRTFSKITDTAMARAAEHIRRALADANLTDASALLTEVSSFRGSTWPLVVGRLVRTGTRGAICLDLAAASHALETLEPLECTGEPANVRATHFELSVQRAIDESPWKPPESLAPMRGRSLRRGGADISDVDALGERHGVLLLISCKSMIYRGSNDIGEHSAVRNRAHDICRAVQDWHVVVQQLRDYPVGDNYDFRRFDRIVGLVCTSHLHWVPLGVAVQEPMPGLLAACSFAELRRWLAS